MTGSIDRINMRTMNNPAVVAQYARNSELSAAEQASLDQVAGAACGKPILDIGVGGGRTVQALLDVSDDYLGVDYSPDMVEACRRRFPEARFACADARAMSDVADGSIFLAMFSCNGIGMVSHEDRLLILREVHRVLQPGGFFLFSTHNRNSPEYSRGFQFPSVEWSMHPLRALVRSTRFVAHTALRVFNRSRFVSHEIRTPGYSVINDVCHHYGTMLYYVTLDNQRQQLTDAGFSAGAQAYDLHGQLVTDDTAHDSIALVARKPMQDQSPPLP